MPRARTHPGRNAEQSNRSDGRVRLRLAGAHRFSVLARAAISFFDFAPTGYRCGLPGGVCASGFSGRREAGEETLGQHETVQERIEEARFSLQSERDANYPHSRGRCGPGVRILEETF